MAIYFSFVAVWRLKCMECFILLAACTGGYAWKTILTESFYHEYHLIFNILWNCIESIYLWSFLDVYDHNMYYVHWNRSMKVVCILKNFFVWSLQLLRSHASWEHGKDILMHAFIIKKSYCLYSIANDSIMDNSFFDSDIPNRSINIFLLKIHERT